jgi:UDP-glucose 4-epimerase
MDAAVGGVFNLGQPAEISMRDLAERIRDAAGSSSEIVRLPYETVYGHNFSDVPRRVPDVSRAAEVLHFRAAVSLEDGLRTTIDWFREQHDEF